MIHFICALKSEAEPLLKYFRLKHSPGNRPFSIYLSEDKGISLTVSGVGKIASAAATSYTFATLQCQQNEIWLNVGMAGHRSHEIGKIFICNHIRDAGSGKKWYPHIVFESEIPRQSLITLDAPSSNYEDCLFDMEASGFVSTASRFSYLEFVQTLKFISDNAGEPARTLKPGQISSLLSPHLDSIGNIVARLRVASDELKSIIDSSDYYEDFLQLGHFSDYQQKKLRQTLQRWCLLLPGESPIRACNIKAQSANKVISKLNEHMDALSFSLSTDKEDV